MPSLKILVIRFSSIGDIVLTTPVLRCLKNQIPDAEIHFLTKQKFSRLVETNPYISKVYTIEKSVVEVIGKLRRESYDHILDLHKNLRSRQVILALMKPAHSFDKLNFEKWLLVKMKSDRMPDLHIVDRYMQVVKFLNITNDGKGLDFFIPETDEVDTHKLPVHFRSGYVGLVIGGRHRTKILPVDKVIELCHSLNFPVILLGGSEDAGRGDVIATACGEMALNACGKFNLMQSASLVKQSLAVVSNDTGLMHIAAAFRKPVVSVWGNTVPELGMYPYLPEGTPQLICEVKGLGCRPCSKIGFDSCPKEHFHCMRDQNTDAMVAFLKNHLR